MKTNITFRMVAFTDAAGKYSPEAARNGNEDNFFFAYDLSKEAPSKGEPDVDTIMSDCGLLMVVADGMGGMNAGEVASQIAVDTVAEFFAPGKINPELAKDHQKRKKYLEHVICEADVRIKKDSKHDTGHKGMGSTIIMAWIVGDELTLSWCGDSRAYRYNPAAGIELLSTDHSYVQELVEQGLIRYEDTFDHPQGNIVTRSLGDTSKKATPESRLYKVYNNDIIMLCSDGLSGVLRDKKTYDMDGELIEGDTLEDIIKDHHGSLKECREALWRAAEKADWYDNVTAVLCEIKSGADTYVPQNKEVLPKVQKTHNSIENKIGKGWDIRLTPKGIVISLIGFILIIGSIIWGTSLFFSNKQNSVSTQKKQEDTVPVQSRQEISVQKKDLSFVNAQTILKLKITDIAKNLDLSQTDSFISKLNELVENAKDTTELSNAKNKVALLEQKVPILKKINTEKIKNATNKAKTKSLNSLWNNVMSSDKIENSKWEKDLNNIQKTQLDVNKNGAKENPPATSGSEITEIKTHNATIGYNDTYEGIINFLEKQEYPGYYVNIIKDIDTGRTLFSKDTRPKVLISIKMAVGHQVEITLLPKNK